MIDFHTHILPGIDDGSRNSDMTMAMLAEESAQGVTAIAATPHFYSDRISIDGFLDRRAASLARVQERLADSGLTSSAPMLYTGAEVYYFPGMGKAERLRELTISGTDTVLIEMPFVQWDERIVTEVTDVIREQKLRVVLAHVERYIGYQKNKRYWNQILELPLTVQLNAGSFMKGLRKRHFCLEMLKERPDSIIGSDCHNLESRRPNLAEARAVIEKKLGSRTLAAIDAKTEAVLEI